MSKMTATLHKGDSGPNYKAGDTIVIYGRVTSESDEGCKLDVTRIEAPKPAKRKKSNPIQYLKEKQRAEIAQA